MTASNQKYLKAVYVLSLYSNIVRVVDIADTLSVSKASVCGALKRLSDKGFVIHELYGDVRLTPEGEKKAKAIITAYGRMKRTISREAELPSGR